MDKRRKYLQSALLVFGVVALLLYPLMVLWPAGWAWTPPQREYEQMMVGIYATLGAFLVWASWEPEAHLSLIWFTVWSSVVHGGIMTVQAIADPTRREIIRLLSQQSLNLNTLSENFDVSRQAVSLHLKILQECGLLTIETKGRERYCQVKLEPMKEVSDWAGQYRQHWEKRLDSLDNYLDKLQKQRKNAKRKK